MRETQLIPEYEVLPPEESISLWLNESFGRFQAALKTTADHFNNKIGMVNIVGFEYELVNGKLVFTGSQFCEDSTFAYGKALKTQYPFIKNVRVVHINPKPLHHMLFGFDMNNTSYFLDGTYGQVNSEENKFCFDKLSNINRYYSLKPFNKRLIDSIKDDYPNSDFVVKTDTMAFADFNKSYKRRLKRELVSNGRKFEYTDFLYRAILNRQNCK